MSSQNLCSKARSLSFSLSCLWSGLLGVNQVTYLLIVSFCVGSRQTKLKQIFRIRKRSPQSAPLIRHFKRKHEGGQILYRQEVPQSLHVLQRYASLNIINKKVSNRNDTKKVTIVCTGLLLLIMAMYFFQLRSFQLYPSLTYKE